MNDSKLFHIGTILSVTTGRLVSPTGLNGVYEILSYMAGESVYTHQIPRFGEECAPWLLRQHPQLANVTLETLDTALQSHDIVEARRNHENAEKIWQRKAAKYRRSGRRADQLEMWDADEYVKATRGDLQLLLNAAVEIWLFHQAKIIGATQLPVVPIPADDHVRLDAVEELNGMVGADRVIVIEGGDGNDTN
jgi:hypothetical protein